MNCNDIVSCIRYCCFNVFVVNLYFLLCSSGEQNTEKHSSGKKNVPIFCYNDKEGKITI